jgi:hypothetical protein
MSEKMTNDDEMGRETETGRITRKNHYNQWVRILLKKMLFVFIVVSGRVLTIYLLLLLYSWTFQEEMFEALKKYKSKFGDCLVPKRYKNNPKLGTCKCSASKSCYGKNLFG